MDRFLDILKAHCTHWRSVIPMMQNGVISMRENSKDVTAESIAECKRLLAETEVLIAKIEAETA